MITAAIIDDNPANRALNKRLLNEYFPDIQVVGEAGSVKTAVELLKKTKPGLVLLDIEIKGGTGFQVLQALKPYNFKVVFITAFDSFALKAIKFSAVDYIVKSVNEVEFQQAIQHAIDTLYPYENRQAQNDYLLENYKKQTQPGKIVLRTAEAIHLVDINEIVYCRSDNAYTSFYLEQGEEIIVSDSIKSFAEMLKEYNFFRPHQSYLVNLNFVKRIDKADGGFLVLKNGKEIPVSSRRKKLIIDLLSRL